MIAVSNTTPLRYLIAIDQETLLSDLFEKVLVPRAVHEELTEPRTPEKVRRKVLSFSGWYQVREILDPQPAAFPVMLHRGERQAILLAEETKADILLIDDYVGRAISLRRNLPLSGTLGVLERADSLGFINDFSGVLDSLQKSGFFIAESLHRQMLERHKARGRMK